MRILKMISVLIIVLFLFSCANNELIYSDSYVFGQDSQYFVLSNRYNMIETENSIYFLTGPGMGFLNVYDKENMKTVPVCIKPNCLHADEPDPAKKHYCNSFLGSGQITLAYYEGFIYYVIDSSSPDGSIVYVLNKTSLDGTKRQRVFIFKEIPQNIRIHRGYIYFTNTLQADDNTIDYKLCRIKLNNDAAKTEIIEQGNQIGGIIGSVLCYGNNIFYVVAHYADSSMENRFCFIKRFNIQTKTVNTFISEPGVIGGFTIFNGKFIYPIPGQGTYACDLDGTNPTKIFDEYGINLAGENMLYIDNISEAIIYNADRRVTVLDKNWQVVKTVPLKGLREVLLGCVDDSFFVPDLSRSNDFGPIHSIYRVSPEESEPELFFQFVPKVQDNGVTYESP